MKLSHCLLPLPFDWAAVLPFDTLLGIPSFRRTSTEREGEREGQREGGREGEKEGGREGGREGERAGRTEGGRGGGK